MNFKKILQKLKRPKGNLLVLVYVLTFVFCGCAIASLFIPVEALWFDVLSYVLYALAAITLGYTTYTVVIYAPYCKRKIVGALRRHALTEKLLESFDFRTLSLLTVSFALSVFYGAYNAVLGGVFQSIWYGALAAYYVIMALMRSSVMFSHRKIKKGLSDEFHAVRTYRRCGYMLIVTILALSAAIVQMIVANASFKHEGIFIYVAAAYTFCRVPLAIVNVVRVIKENKDFTMRSIVGVNLAEAAVSVLNLQTAMFYSFADPLSTTTDFANALTGGAVCLLILLLGGYMIVHGTKTLKKLRLQNNSTEEE